MEAYDNSEFGRRSIETGTTGPDVADAGVSGEVGIRIITLQQLQSPQVCPLTASQRSQASEPDEHRSLHLSADSASGASTRGSRIRCQGQVPPPPG